VADLESKYRPGLEAQLEEGEDLRGITMASQQKGMFKGGAVIIGMTDRRLLIQAVDRRGRPAESLKALRPDQIAEVKAGGAGGGWISPGNLILDAAAKRLEIRTADGETLKLMLMGGAARPLAEWFRTIEAT
jgi:hypothetical protein